MQVFWWMTFGNQCIVLYMDKRYATWCHFIIFHRYPVNSVVKHHTYTSSNIFKLCAQETGGGFTDGPTVEFSAARPYASAFCWIWMVHLFGKSWKERMLSKYPARKARSVAPQSVFFGKFLKCGWLSWNQVPHSTGQVQSVQCTFCKPWALNTAAKVGLYLWK